MTDDGVQNGDPPSHEATEDKQRDFLDADSYFALRATKDK